MSEPKFKPGQFVSTSIGRMRVKKTKDIDACHKCALSIKDKDNNIIFWNCGCLYDKYHNTCCDLIGFSGYLEKV